MKRLTKFILIIMILTLFSPVATARNGEKLTITTPFKETVIENGFFNIDGNIYLPLIPVCEALGSVVFENPVYSNFFILSRDGDTISHSLYYDSFEFNGENINVGLPSTHDDTHRILVPFPMLEKMYGIEITRDNGKAVINKPMWTNYYNNLVSGLLKYSIYGDFYAENFSRYYKYYSYHGDMDPGVVINSVNIGLDLKRHEDSKIVTNPDDTAVLINKTNRLPSGFSAKNLVAVDRKYSKGSGFLLNSEAYENYRQMYTAAANERRYLKIVSAYRTEAYQRNLYNSYLRNNGLSYAAAYSAQPGYSEHQTGLAIDINSVYTSFEKSAEYTWLKNHAHEYGFIERYKKGREYITGYAYEPWHYRYVGKEAAAIIREKDITYEEYYAVYLHKSPYFTDKDRTWANVVRFYYE